MKRFLVAAILCFAFSLNVWAQQTAAADSPATKDDVEKYLVAVHSREMMDKMMDAMSKPMHKMVHEQYLKDKDKLPADFEARTNKLMDDMFKNMPWDEMLQAMVPAYQKHFTKGDLQSLTAFYNSPTGQKVLREMPAIMSEAMESMMPIMQRQMEAINKSVQDEMAQMLKESDMQKKTNRPVTAN